MEPEVTLNWLSNPNLLALEELPAFFGKNGKGYEKGGIYFWIYVGESKRIAYIGETENFKNRFEEHLANALHGKYTAVDCQSDNNLDLQDYYERKSARGKKTYYEPKNIQISYPDDPDVNPKKVQIYSHDAMKKHADDIKEGIKKNLEYMKKLYFIFFGMNDVNNTDRRKIEALFMLLLLTKLKNKKEKHKPCPFSDNGYYWGRVSLKPDLNHTYRLKFENEIPPILVEELGLGDSKEKKWNLKYDGEYVTPE